MGKPSYLQRNRWQQDKQFIRLLEHCRRLVGRKKGQTIHDLARFHLGNDGRDSLRRMRRPLLRVFWILAGHEGLIFGPVRRLGETLWYIATERWEAQHIAARHLKAMNSRLRRFRNLDLPELQANWERNLGGSVGREMLRYDGFRALIEGVWEKGINNIITCPNCDTQVLNGRFCSSCGTRLTEEAS